MQKQGLLRDSITQLILEPRSNSALTSLVPTWRGQSIKPHTLSDFVGTIAAPDAIMLQGNEFFKNKQYEEVILSREPHSTPPLRLEER